MFYRHFWKFSDIHTGMLIFESCHRFNISVLSLGKLKKTTGNLLGKKIEGKQNSKNTQIKKDHFFKRIF